MTQIYAIDTTRDHIYQKKVWGDSQAIARIMGPLPPRYAEDTIGEVFLASTHPDGLSYFESGKSFDDVIASQECKRTFGHGVYGYAHFPLLLKVLSATQPLSIQTHYANKVEAWYALSDGEMLYGLTQEGERMLTDQKKHKAFAKILHETTDKKTMARYFNHVHFHAGDAFIIHAGIAHALISGTVFEPQRNSNLTNRGGDWGRNDVHRPLHLNAFFESLYPFAVTPHAVQRVVKDVQEQSQMAHVFATQYFALEELTLNGTYTLHTDEHHFMIGFCIDGIIEIASSHDRYQCVTGSTFLLPAGTERWVHTGEGKILYTSIPRLMEGIIMPLLNNGTSLDDIIQLGGVVHKENDLYIEMKEQHLL